MISSFYFSVLFFPISYRQSPAVTSRGSHSLPSTCCLRIEAGAAGRRGAGAGRVGTVFTLVSHACPFLNPSWREASRAPHVAAAAGLGAGSFGLQAPLQERSQVPHPLLHCCCGIQVLGSQLGLAGSSSCHQLLTGKEGNGCCRGPGRSVPPLSRAQVHCTSL